MAYLRGLRGSEREHLDSQKHFLPSSEQATREGSINWGSSWKGNLARKKARKQRNAKVALLGWKAASGIRLSQRRAGKYYLARPIARAGCSPHLGPSAVIDDHRRKNARLVGMPRDICVCLFIRLLFLDFTSYHTEHSTSPCFTRFYSHCPINIYASHEYYTAHLVIYHHMRLSVGRLTALLLAPGNCFTTYLAANGYRHPPEWRKERKSVASLIILSLLTDQIYNDYAIYESMACYIARSLKQSHR